MPKKNPAPAKVESIRHKDKRPNIPTEELRDFVADDEAAPKTMLYPRDPSLDPQLVWKGKDEQDREDLSVPVVPIYIQEKIHPQAIIDDLLDHAARPAGGRIAEEAVAYQAELFADFNGGPHDFADKIDFYNHEQNWTNRMILGDSLLVMTSLAEKEGLKGKVQTIYIDPPYGIKFGSNWQVSTRKRDVKDGKAEDATRQPEQIRAFRDTWKLGIHSYLAYLRDRLTVARDLLTETGSIFVQIGDENVHLVRCVLDEVFGSENFVSQITFKKTSGAGSPMVSTLVLPGTTDFIIWYAKDFERLKYRQLYAPKPDATGQYVWADNGVRRWRPSAAEHLAEDVRWFRPSPLTSESTGSGGTTVFPVTWKSDVYTPPKGGWKTNRSGMNRLISADRLIAVGKTLSYVRYVDDFPAVPYTSLWEDTQASGFGDPKLYVVQTNSKVIERCLLMTTDPGDLVLDPTCGSGTTAYVAEQWGRRWITCDTSRVALALARTRLMAAKFPYYLLADSPEGIKKETELTGKTPPGYKTGGDIRKGFVYKRVPHITLKSIANNPDIREGMTREEIDAAIARHADTETLFDQPYTDNKRVRVTGPFSVESLSPHRVLSTADDNLDGTVSEQEAKKEQDFATMILDNLKKAGVQNTRKAERLKFDRLDPYAGTWIQAAGEYTGAEGKIRRVAVSIGPEHGTVGPDQVKEAAKEAVQGIGFDLLIVCGFAFDPHVGEEVTRYGRLTVLPAKMNPDLAMGDELLKKTGAGNLFMVFGEPDIEIKKQHDGQIVVEINGVDVYDPTTGQIRGSSTDDIACWFIDTDYNGESFFVRHAYFTGADEPYDKLKRALRADIDEDAWRGLYATVSRPFDPPSTGKIAVKVINHYGDEVLTVYPV
ncbi:site-specific DNA-methyltransferase [Nitrolancea hollandica]|uniref:site-specific DNA-methyltransferase (adenine-specific) n=1 Tax=Nitrolancea hollandica Lb TaxID=1129897 RepID=I4EF46_9BACT|nr:site-specific DNA-methyltransferase [Nitrolancea hollandica]CCF83308.1 DNA methylase [Nitrolancea hollandica Lb]